MKFADEKELVTDQLTDGPTDGQTNGPTDRRTDIPTDRRTDTPSGSYRDAWTHLKSAGSMLICMISFFKTCNFFNVPIGHTDRKQCAREQNSVPRAHGHSLIIHLLISMVITHKKVCKPEKDRQFWGVLFSKIAQTRNCLPRPSVRRPDTRQNQLRAVGQEQ